MASILADLTFPIGKVGIVEAVLPSPPYPPARRSRHALSPAGSDLLPSPRDAAGAPPEKLAYVAAYARPADRPDAIAVLNVDESSAAYGKVVGWTDLPNLGDELHHFGWNECGSALCPYAPHPHAERRYLVVPGLRSSRIYVLDTKQDPAAPILVKVLEADELGKRAGYSRPHTVHCGPEGTYVSALGGFDGEDGGGVRSAGEAVGHAASVGGVEVRPGGAGSGHAAGRDRQAFHPRSLGLGEEVFADTSDRIVAAWRARAARMFPSDFADAGEPVRYTLLAALCWTRQAELVDGLVTGWWSC